MHKFLKFDALRSLLRPFLDPSSGFSVALGRLNSDSIWDVHVTTCVEYIVWFEHRVYQISSRLSPHVHQKVGRGTENKAYMKLLPLMRPQGRGF